MHPNCRIAMKKESKTNEQLLKEIELLSRKVANLEQVEEELKIQSHRNQLILETTMDSYILADSNGKIIEVNQAYCDLIGYSYLELLNMNIRNLEVKTPPEEVERRIQEMVSKGKDRFETKHQHKKGQILDFETSISILHIAEDALVAAFMRDVTKRNQIEKEIKQNDHLLRESQKVASLGSYILSIADNKWSSSEILDTLFGIDNKYNTDVEGWMKIVHPDDQAEMREYFLKSVLEDHGSFDKEYRIIRVNDQKQRWVHGLGELEYGEDGNPVKMIGTILDITDRKNAEKELQESEFRFRTIIEQATDALYIIDFEGAIVEVNHKACVNLGYSKEELLTMNIASVDEQYMYADYEYRDAIMLKLHKGENTTVETTHRRKDGTSFPVETSLGIIDIKNKQYILGFTRDISDRKKGEEALLKMNMAINNSNEVVFMTDIDGIITFVNPEFTKMYGYTAKEVVGKVTPRIIKSGQVTKEMSEMLWNTLLRKESIPASQYVNKRKNNKLIDVEGSANPILDSDGAIIGFLGIQRDITKRKRSEQIQSVLYNISNAANTTGDLKNLISKIQEELGSVIDTSNFYVALYDEESKTISLPYFVDEKDKMDSIPAGKTLSHYVILSQNTLLANKETIKKLERSGDIEKHGTDPEIWLGVPLRNNGRVTGVLAVQSYSDESAYNETDMQMLEFVSDQISISIYRKKAEQDLKEALEKATESDRLKSTFLATMSHELRTPLNAIIGFSDIIDEELTVKEIVEYAKIINSSGNQLLGIVEDLFDITLIEAGEIKIRKRNESLNSIMEYVYNIIEIERQTISKDNLGFTLTIPSDENSLIINTDPVKLKQILINLLRNAIKFTEEGYVDFGYELIRDQNKAEIKFYVEDTGKGIPENKQSLIFDIFTQIEDATSRAFGGTGIGLSIAKKLTEILGGKIWLDSVADKGSMFYFTIPYEGQLSEERPISKGIKELSKNTIKAKEKTVLIAEDDEPSYKYLKIILEQYKINPIWVNSGLKAIQACKDNSDIDLVLMDINMPEMDGFEATREIKKFKPELPIIAQTAYAVEGDRAKAMKAGCDDYISKPIKKEVLITKIENYISSE